MEILRPQRHIPKTNKIEKPYNTEYRNRIHLIASLNTANQLLAQLVEHQVTVREVKGPQPDQHSGSLNI